MKKCPKCGADNKPDSSACYNCFSSLADVPSTGAVPGPLNPQPLNQHQNVPPVPPQQPINPISLSGGGYAPRSGGPLNSPPPAGPPADEQTVVGQPLGGQPQQPQPPSPYGTQPGPYSPQQPYPRRGEYRKPEPVKSSGSGAMIAVILLVIALIGGGGFAYWKFVAQKSGPKGTVRQFLAAAQKHDLEAMKSYLCKSTLANPYLTDKFYEGIDTALEKNNNKRKPVEGIDFTLIAGPNDDTTATVYVKDKVWKSSTPEEFKEKGVPLILVKEDNKWKIDVTQTIQQMMGPIMRQLQQQGGGFGGSYPR